MVWWAEPWGARFGGTVDEDAERGSGRGLTRGQGEGRNSEEQLGGGGSSRKGVKDDDDEEGIECCCWRVCRGAN